MTALLAARIREAGAELTQRWLEAIAARMSVASGRTFPTDELLDHGPTLMAGIADCMDHPIDGITADVSLVATAAELAELTFGRGFDVNDILQQYEILGSVLFTFCGQIAAESGAGTRDDLLLCGERIFRALSATQQTTITHYLRVLNERIGDREERLRRFNRMITHDLKNRVGATLGAGELLQEEWLGDPERRRFAGMIAGNAQAIQTVLENLSALARVDGERRRERTLEVGEVVRDVFRQLRELALARSVDLRIAGDLPSIEVNAAPVELCLSNYLSNAIRYSDASAPRRWAEVEVTVEESADPASAAELVVRVHDNGIGVPPAARPHLFERFFRAHTETMRAEGPGLGLHMVMETVASLGGRAWAEFDAGAGSVFAFALPCREAERRAVPGISGSGAESRGGRSRSDPERATASD